jgi:hypothetical protein
MYISSVLQLPQAKFCTNFPFTPEHSWKWHLLPFMRHIILLTQYQLSIVHCGWNSSNGGPFSFVISILFKPSLCTSFIWFISFHPFSQAVVEVGRTATTDIILMSFVNLFSCDKTDFCKEFYLLRYNAVQSGKTQPVFQRNISFPF